MKLADSPFRKGLYMRVPKGTPLYNSYQRSRGEAPELTKRDVVVEIHNVSFPNTDSTLTIEEIQERQRRLDEIKDGAHVAYEALTVKVHYPAVTYPGRGPGGSYTKPAYDRDEVPEARRKEATLIWDDLRSKTEAIHKEYADLGGSRFNLGEVLVSWANMDKTAQAQYLEIVDKPAIRSKQPKVNLRQQMVSGSRWKFTKDTDIFYGAPNPAYHKIIDAWDAANPRPGSHHRTKTSDADWKTWQDGREAMRQAAIKSPGEYVPRLYRSIKAGEIFTVMSKFNSYWMPNGWSGESYGNAAPVTFDGETDVKYLEYSMIKDSIEAESIPTVDVWVLRYKPTGLFYAGPDYSEGWRGRENNGVEDQQMVETFMKGKKWDNLGRAKTSILTMTGYYDGLPGADESLPEWGGGGKTFDMTDDWELVKFDKLARREIEVVQDFQEWYAKSWQLRALTVKFGSSVRSVYKALEKANLLATQKGMVVFTEVDEDKLDNVGVYGDKTAITKEEQDLIDAAVASTKAKKGSYKKATDHKSVAVSFTNKGAAMMFKLAYGGNLKTTILDLETLTEAVDD